MNKTVVITGASGGIGAATVRVFAKNGYNIVAGYCNGKEPAKSLEAELLNDGCNIITVKSDMRVTSDVNELFDAADRKFGGVDSLVCNAGIARQQLLTDITDNDWNEIFDVNMSGVFRCCRAVVPYMLRNHSGSIVNVSSMWGISGASCESAYSSSKAAVIGFTKSIAQELGPSGIRVNCVAPGVIDTKMNSEHSGETMKSLSDSTPLLRIGTPEEVAEAIYFLASEKSSFITGQILTVDGGFLL